MTKSQKLEVQKTKFLVAKNERQKEYIKLIKEKTIVFATGEAGSGKSYCACSVAIQELKANKIERIVLSRPAVEAGESLGFLPGDISEKIDPYMIPLFNIFREYVDQKELNILLESKAIQIIPLAFLRGHTLSNCIAIVDEAENMNYSQLKNLLTRIGSGCRLLINGDITQSDLKYYEQGALEDVIEALSDMEEVGIIEFLREDIVRHPLISKILDRLDKLDKPDAAPKGYVR